LLGAKEPLIGIHAAARDATRQWALERFAAVAVELLRRHGGTIVLLGDAEERNRGEMLIEEVNRAGLNLAGRTSLVELGAVIARLSALVTNDTGPAHIAYAVGTPTVTIFGSADPKRYGPLQAVPFRIQVHEVPCRPCGYTECPIGYKCLEGVTVEQVVEAAEEVMR
jgi:ADP-heptose:LPS heptosyltransferase